jgi:hypothetical protein
MNFKTATPVEIDTELAALYNSNARKNAAASRAVNEAVTDADPKGRYNFQRSAGKRYNETPRERRARVIETAQGGTPHYTALHAAIAAEAKVFAECRATEAPYEAAYTARRWSRFYHVTNTNGHVHSSRGCSTCFPTTQYGWLTQLSGSTEAELIAVMGDTACTVCYPTAPTFRGFGDGTSYVAKASAAEKAAKADAKAAKVAAKVAKGITFADGSPVFEMSYSGGLSTRSYKTERAARIDLVTALVSTAFPWPGGSHDNHKRYLATAEYIAPALAHKNGQTLAELWQVVAPKVRAKAKREGRI